MSTAPKPELDKRALLGRLLRERAAAGAPSRYPLSSGQRSLWFVHRSSPQSNAYNIAFSFRIVSALDTAAVRASLRKLIDRHPLLRTTFAAEDGTPFQTTAAAAEPAFEVTDSSSQSLETIRAQALETADEPFDLERGPLLRVRLFSRSLQDHILLIVMHHIMHDGWSLWLLLDELAAFYAAELSGLASRLPPPERTYAAFVQSQREILASPEGRLHEEYWRRELGGDLPVLNLPLDKPRPREQQFQGRSSRFRIPAHVTAGLRDLAQREGVTLFMTLLAAWQVLLHRWSNQTDILVGTPTSGRRQNGYGDVVGFFADPIVMRADLSGDPPFTAFLAQVRRTVLDGLQHQDFPLLEVIERLRLPRDAGRSPVFQACFAFQKPRQFEGISDLYIPPSDDVRVRWAGLEAEPFIIPQCRSWFDITLEMMDAHNGLGGILTWDTGLFEDVTIARMERHFQRLLEAVAADASQRVSALPLLTADERAAIVAKQGAIETALPYRTLVEGFETHAATNPHAPALEFEDEVWSYAELNRRANQLAHLLIARGVVPDTPVGLCFERSMNLVLGMLAILKAGGAYVPLDPGYPPDRLTWLIHDSAVSLVLTTSAHVDDLGAAASRALCIDDVDGRFSDANPNVELDPEHLAYLMYTSGSTGKPKGALITHRNVLAFMTSTGKLAGASATDVWTLFHSCAFDFSVWEIWGALLFGGRLVVVPFATSRDPEAFHRLLHDRGVTVLNQTPTAFRHLSQANERAGADTPLHLRTVIFGGEALSGATFEAWCRRHGDSRPTLANMYGITETTVTVTWRDVLSSDCARPGSPIGRPLAHLRVYILDANLEPVPEGLAGEIYIGGTGLGRGYFGRPDLTVDRFVPDPFSGEPGARLYRSGDLARSRGGDIEYLGRADQQVKIRGHRIELSEIESALKQHAGVRAVAVLPRTEAGHTRLIAYIAAHEGNPEIVRDLKTHVRAVLPDYMAPAAFILVPEMPMTPNGKLDQRALLSLDTADSEPEPEFTAPRNEIETRLAAIWREVLNLPHIGIRDNFFALGGDSILTLQVSARANRDGLAVTTRQMFQYQTIEELAAVASTAKPAAVSSTAAGPVPLSPIQQWFFEDPGPEPHYFNQSTFLDLPNAMTPGMVEAVVRRVIEIHDALRLRITSTGSGWQQQSIPAEADTPFRVFDFRNALQDLPAAVERIQRSLNFTTGPIVRAALFIETTRQRLLLAIHHLAIDGVSWRVLFDDIRIGCDQALQARPILPVVPAHATFASWVQALPAAAPQGHFWLAQKHLAADLGPYGTCADARHVTLSLAPGLTAALLRDANDALNTRPEELLLTALARAIRIHTGNEIVSVDLESHGRDALPGGPDVSGTVGWFASLYPVRLATGARNSGFDDLKSIKEQLRAVPDKGIGYGILRYLSPDPDVRRALAAQPQCAVRFNYLGQFDPALSGLVDGVGAPVFSPLAPRRHAVEVDSFIANGSLQARWTYHRTQPAIERLAHSWLRELESLIAECQAGARQAFTASDFPLAGLDRQKLGKLSRLLDRKGSPKGLPREIDSK